MEGGRELTFGGTSNAICIEAPPISSDPTVPIATPPPSPEAVWVEHIHTHSWHTHTHTHTHISLCCSDGAQHRICPRDS